MGALKTIGYVILMYTIYAVLETYFRIGGMAGGAIAGLIVGVLAWVIDKVFPKKKKTNSDDDTTSA